MLENTDLDSCKNKAKQMLNYDIKIIKSFVISHPFFQYSDVICYNILEDKNAYNILKKQKEEFIDSITDYTFFQFL